MRLKLVCLWIANTTKATVQASVGGPDPLRLAMQVFDGGNQPPAGALIPADAIDIQLIAAGRNGTDIEGNPRARQRRNLSGIALDAAQMRAGIQLPATCATALIFRING